MFAEIIQFFPAEVDNGGNGFDPVVFVIFTDDGLNKPGWADGVVSLEVNDKLRLFGHGMRQFYNAVGSGEAVGRSHHRFHIMLIAKVDNALVIRCDNRFTAFKLGGSF